MAQTEKKHRGSQAKKWKRPVKGNGKKACKMENCKRPYRAKGYCYFHYQQWRRGELGDERYKICGNADCKKRQFKGGLCEQHYNESRGIKPEAAAAPAA